VDLTVEGGEGRVAVTVTSGSVIEHVSFSSPAITATSDALVPLALLPAMAQREDLSLPEPISPRLWNATDELQSLFTAWYGLAPVAITVPGVSAWARPLGRRAACFFSCGVDSFFSALELAPLLDALVLVRGFDFAIGRLEEPDGNQIVARASAAATTLGLDLVVVSTDLRRWSDRRLLWGDQYVGSGLATVAHLLSETFSQLYVPATHAERDEFPYGTHPLTDPMWSSDHLEIQVHGASTPRPDKVERIARFAPALRSLRVCWENRDGAYNCGKCSKCLRTMVELWGVGALERCETLPDTIDPDLVAASLVADDPSSVAFARQLLTSLGRRRGLQAAALRRAVESVLP
jgi:hypothetical protein